MFKRKCGRSGHDYIDITEPHQDWTPEYTHRVVYTATDQGPRRVRERAYLGERRSIHLECSLCGKQTQRSDWRDIAETKTWEPCT